MSSPQPILQSWLLWLENKYWYQEDWFLSLYSFFLFKIILADAASLPFRIKFRKLLSISTWKKSHLFFFKNCIKAVYQLAYNWYLYYLNLPIDEYGMLLHLFKYFFISSSTFFLLFSIQLVYISLDLYVLHSIQATVYGIAFLFWLFIYSLLVYWNTFDFCMFILHPTSLLNSFIHSRKDFCFVFLLFCVLPEIFFKDDNQSCHLKDSFISIFQVHMPFICFIALFHWLQLPALS